MENKSLRLLPVLLLVATLAFAVRLGEVVVGAKSLPGQAIAEEEKKAADAANAHAEPAHKDGAAEKAADAPPAATADKALPDTKASGEGSAAAAKPAWPDPAEMDPELADVRSGLLKDLAARRKQLDDREKELTTREAVLKAAESELDQKIKELGELRKQLQGLLNQQSEEENASLKSLVRIYEGMKPADAARIFNTLDITILIDVISTMSERKSAPILAAMDPERARTVTLLLAQKKKLPDTQDGQLPPAQ